MPIQYGFVCALILLVVSAGRPAPAHPRIFLTPEDLPRLRAMSSDHEKNALGYVPAEAWQEIQAVADRFVSGPAYHYSVNMPAQAEGPAKRWEYTLSKEPPPRHDDYAHYPPWTAMFQERGDAITTRLKYLVLAYVVTQDAKYFERAKEIALNMCAWPIIWTDPSYGGGRPCLDTGHAATWVAIFYDWCHAGLSEGERDRVRTALAEKALLPIDALIDSIAPYHNYTAVIANGLCIGGIALLGEDERAQGWVEHAVTRLRMNFDVQGKDGGPMEGPMYGTYAADQAADMIWALTTADIPNELFEHHYVKTLPRYCISLANPNNLQMPCFGDGGPSKGAMGRLMLTIALRGDADAAWYCQQTGQFSAESPRGFIILDPERLRPSQPTLNPSDCFVDVGYAILRDGYKPGTAFMALKCGPPDMVVGHNHFDHNSFVINFAGQWVAWDPGYRSYFNPPERRYTTSTLGHSSIVLDMDEAYLNAEGHPNNILGHDQMRLDGGRIREFFTSDHYDYALGDAAETYNTDAVKVLDRFDRQVVFAKPNVFFIRDTLAAPEAHTYSFLLHLDASGEFEIAGHEAIGASTQALLQTSVFSPEGAHLTAATYPGAENRGPYLAATTGKTKATTITSVLVPRRHGKLIRNGGFEKGMAGWSPRNVPENINNHVIDNEVKHSGDASARIDNAGYYYSRRFYLPPGAEVTARWWAKCTAQKGATSVLYYWRDGKAFAHTNGPRPDADEWKQYEFSGVVPDGTEEIRLALNFFEDGQCWFDDVEVIADLEVPASEPAKVTPLDEGASGAVCEVDGITHILVCGKAGELREFEAAGRRIATDAEMAVVSLTADGARAFVLRGTQMRVDGEAVEVAGGEWRAGGGPSAANAEKAPAAP